MGTPSYASNILFELSKDKRFEICKVFTQPDKPVGRKKILTPSAVKIKAIELGFDVFQPENLNTQESIDIIKNAKPDFIVVAAYGQLLKKEILQIAPCINLHASILPDYRGASPIQETLLNGDKFAGVTAMLMEEGLDCGDMLGFSYLENIQTKTNEDLMQELSYLASDLTKQVLVDFNAIRPQKQRNVSASYVKKRTKKEAVVELKDANQVDRKFRAFFPWPGVFLESGLALKNIKLNEMHSKNKIGEILKINKDSIVVGCEKGSLIIFSLQAPSKNEMDAVSFIRGKRLSCGDTLLQRD